MTDPWDDVQPIGVRPTGAPAPPPTRQPDTAPSRSTTSARTTSTTQPESPTRTGVPISGPGDQRDAHETQQEPAPLRALSIGEKQQRARVTRAESHAQFPRTGAGAGTERAGAEAVRSRAKLFSRSPLAVGELIAMTSQLARSLHADSFGERAKAAERKHYAIGYAVMVDKLNALSGRPTSIVGITDGTRDGVLELAARLALAARESA